MARTVDLVFVDYKEVWLADAAMTEVVKDFREMLKDIGTNIKNQNIDISGIYENKLNMKTAFIDNTIDIQSRIASLASSIKDSALYNMVDNTQTDLFRFTDAQLYEHGELIIDLYDKHKDALVPYGVDEKMIEEYGKEAVAYINYSREPRKAIAIRKVATQNLEELIPDLVYEMSHTVGTNMIRFDKTNKEFFAAFRNASVVVDGPVHKLAALGKIIDEETKLPLQYVKVTFSPKNGVGAVTVIRSAITTELGNYRIKSLEEGAYVVTFVLPNYDTITIDIYYFKGQQLKLNEALRKTE